MEDKEFREYGIKFVDLIADYFRDIEQYDVLPNSEPGNIKNQLPENFPEAPEDFNKVFEDIKNIILPNLTHWNHPGFLAYFNSTSSGPGILAEFLSAALNINSMLWKTGPASAELEERMMEWYRNSLGLPQDFWGIIYDTASVSTMHGIAAARDNAYPDVRRKGMRNDMRLYCSEHAHSSIEKGAVTLGIGLDNVVKIESDENFRMITSKLDEAIEKDMKKGMLPFCVVATIGTTSSTSVDPVPEIAEICRKNNLWLHVDAAFAGTAALIPEERTNFNGWEEADSIVVNPHKWMFTPVDLSVFLTRKKDILKRAFSLVPEYLKTAQDTQVINYMDYGLQLGRRFRSLKLWFIFRYYGLEKIRNILRSHIKMAKDFEDYIAASTVFELTAPRTFSVVCFRAIHESLNEDELNDLNRRLLDKVNESGKVFMSHTVLNGKYTLRLAVSGIRTERRHIELAQDILKKEYNKLVQ